ncbi:hypothetical protein B484DRAFT_398152 [Ochromonadaceae sp. CCMP2298]|nr:hypothetical protein B484DRAFT_398152 [Ochromonadaceae sp. CCMP2298]
MSASGPSGPSALSLYRKGAAGAAVISICSILAQPAYAQIPSMDDYSSGSGTVVRPKGPKATSTASSTSTDVLSMSRQLPATLNRLQTLAKGEQWDEVINTCKALKPLKLKYLGYSNAPALAQAFDVTASEAGELEILRGEIYSTLVQLSDLSISNRVYFFNKDDLLQAQRLIEESQDGTTRAGAGTGAGAGVEAGAGEDRTLEPLALIQEAQEYVAAFEKLLKAP